MRWFRPFGILVCLGILGPAETASAAPEVGQAENLRGVRYGEIIVVSGGPRGLTGHVYNTLGLNDCPEESWKALDPGKIKKEHHAKAVILNGPRYFLMDTNSLVNPGKVADFGALKARHLADVAIEPRTLLRGRAKPYTDNAVSRTTKYVFKEGKPVYELVSPKGTVYVMQSYSLSKDPGLNEAALSKLGERLKLPKGWSYRVRTPDQDLVVEANGTAYVLQDNLENSYQRLN